MTTRRIHHWVDVGGVPIPLDKSGRALDWRHVRGNYAPVATSPHGVRAFIIQGDAGRVVLDYVVLPDGRYLLSIDEEPSGLGFHAEDLYNIHDEDSVAEAAFRLVEKCSTHLNVQDHERWNLLRAINRELSARRRS